MNPTSEKYRALLRDAQGNQKNENIAPEINVIRAIFNEKPLDIHPPSPQEDPNQQIPMAPPDAPSSLSPQENSSHESTDDDHANKKDPLDALRQINEALRQRGLAPDADPQEGPKRGQGQLPGQFNNGFNPHPHPHPMPMPMPRPAVMPLHANPNARQPRVYDVDAGREFEHEEDTE